MIINRGENEINGKNMDGIRETYDAYSKKSEHELMDDLKRFKEQGIMDDERLKQVADRLRPMLNEKQKERLRNVMESLGKE